MAKSSGRDDDPKSRRAKFLSFLRQDTPPPAAVESAVSTAPPSPPVSPYDAIDTGRLEATHAPSIETGRIEADAAPPDIDVDEIPVAGGVVEAEIPVAGGVLEDDIPEAADTIRVEESDLLAAGVEDDIPQAIGAEVVEAPPSPPRGAVVSEDVIEEEASRLRPEERKKSRWAEVEDNGKKRPSELFPLRGRRGAEPDNAAWEEAREARESQQAAAREAAMGPREGDAPPASGSSWSVSYGKGEEENVSPAIRDEEGVEGGAPPLIDTHVPASDFEIVASEAEVKVVQAGPAVDAALSADVEVVPANEVIAAEPSPIESEVEIVPANVTEAVVEAPPAKTVVPAESVLEAAHATVELPPSAAAREAAAQAPPAPRDRAPAPASSVSGLSSPDDVVISQVSISGDVAPRQEVRFEMRWANRTKHPIRGITLRCDMPQHTSYMPESTAVNGHAVPDERAASPLAGGRGLTLGELAPGQEGSVAFSCVLNPALRDGTLLQHTVHLLQETRTVASTTTFLRARGVATFADSETCRLTAVPSGEIAPGEPIDYTFAVRNVGTAPATGITLVATAPQHAVYVPNSTRWEGRVLTDIEGTSALFSSRGLYLGTLSPGEAHAASYRMRVERPLDAGTELSCSGEVRSHESIPVPIAAVQHVVKSAAAFDFKGDHATRLAVLRNDEEVRDTVPGDVLTFRMLLVNSGDAHAYKTTVWARMPQHVEYVAGSVKRDGTAVADGPDGRPMLFSEEGMRLGKLEAAALDAPPPQHEVTFQGRVAWPLRDGTEIRLEAALAAIELARRDLPAAVVRVHAAPQFVEPLSALEVDPQGKVRPGELLTFTVRCKNSGDAPASRVVLRAGLPAEARYVASSTRHEGRSLPDEDGASPLFGEAGLLLGTIDAGSGVEISFQATVATPLDRGTVISSKAALTCDELPTVAFAPVRVEVVSAPDFGAEKVNRLEVSPPEVVRPGEVLQYTLHYRNHGDANATNVVVRARVPEHTTPVEGSATVDGRSVPDVHGTPPVFTAGGLVLGEVPAGKSGRVGYAVAVNRPLESATQIYHAAAIACDQARPVETKAVLVMVTSTPDFSSGNRLDVFPKGDVSPSQKLTYTLDYRNSGDADATGVYVKASLPAHTSYVADSTRVNGQVVSDFRNSSPLFSPRGLALGLVPVDLGGKITFEVRVNTPLDNGTTLSCQAVVGCAESAATIATNAVENRVASAPDFNQEDVNFMSASPTGDTSPDEVVTYALRYKNTGNARAVKVALRAELSQHTSYKPGTTLLNGRPVADVDGVSALFTAAGLTVGTVDADAAGEATFQAQVHSPLDNGTTLSAQGFILCEPAGQISSNRVTHSVMSLPAFSDPAHTRVEVSPSGAVRPGDRLTYTIQYQNTGKAHAQGVAVRAVVPPQTALVAESVRLGGRAAGSDETRALFEEGGVRVGRVAAGESGSVTYQVDVARPLPHGTTVACHAVLTSSTTQPVTTPSVQTAVHSNVDFSEAAGNRVYAALSEAAPGDTVLYTVRWHNGGDANASGVALRVMLPPELSYVPHMTTLNGQPVPEAGPVGLLMSGSGLPIGEVLAGGGGLANFTLRVGKATADGARLALRVELRSDQGAPVALEAPALSVSAPPDFSDAAYNNLEVYPSGKVACDEVLTYTVNYGNRGNATAPDVALRAHLPENTDYVLGTTFLNGEPVSDAAGTSPLFRKQGLSVGKVEPRVYGNVVFQVRVQSDLANGAQIANSAIIDCGDKYTFTTNQTRNVVSSVPDFSGVDGALLEVTPVGDVSPRDTLTYSFNFRNRGNAAATHVAVRGKLPPHTRYLARSTKLNGLPVQDQAGTSPLFTERGLVIPELAAGGGGRVSLRVQVESPLPSGTAVVASMTLTSQQTPPVTSNKVTSEVLSYPSFSDGTFVQVFPQGAVAPGQVVTFVLYYHNGGSTHAETLHVRAHVPPHTTYVASSTRVDGLAVEDEAGLSPVFSGEGVAVRDVQAASSGNVSFQVMIDADVDEGTGVQTRLDLSTVPQTAPLSVPSPALMVSREARVIEAPPPIVLDAVAVVEEAEALEAETQAVDAAAEAPAATVDSAHEPSAQAADEATAAGLDAAQEPSAQATDEATAAGLDAAQEPSAQAADEATAATVDSAHEPSAQAADEATAATVDSAHEPSAQAADEATAAALDYTPEPSAQAADEATAAAPESAQEPSAQAADEATTAALDSAEEPSAQAAADAPTEMEKVPAPPSPSRDHLPLEKFVPPPSDETPPPAEPERRLTLDIDRLKRVRNAQRAVGAPPSPVDAVAEADVSPGIPELDVSPAIPEAEEPVAEVLPAIPEAEAPLVEDEDPTVELAPRAVEAPAEPVEVEAEAEAEASEEPVLAAPPEPSTPMSPPGTELPLSVYLTLTRDQVDALRELQTSNTGLLAHFEASALLMGRSFYGTYRSDDAKTLNTLMGSLSRSLADYHRGHRAMLSSLVEQLQANQEPALDTAADGGHQEALERVHSFVGRFYEVQRELPLGFSPPRNDPGKKSFILAAHVPRAEFSQVKRLTEDASGAAAFVRHLIFVQLLMGTQTAAREDKIAEELNSLLSEYGMAMKSVLNRLMLNARSNKKLDLGKTSRQLERPLKTLVEFLHQNLP